MLDYQAGKRFGTSFPSRMSNGTPDSPNGWEFRMAVSKMNVTVLDEPNRLKALM